MNILLRLARLQAQLTQEELADLTGSSVVSVWRWENGATPSAYHQQLLCRHLHKAPRELGWKVRSEKKSSSHGCVLDPLMPSPPPAFVGRQPVLTFLHKQLRLPGQQLVAVVGLPG